VLNAVQNALQWHCSGIAVALQWHCSAPRCTKCGEKRKAPAGGAVRGEGDPRLIGRVRAVLGVAALPAWRQAHRQQRKHNGHPRGNKQIKEA